MTDSADKLCLGEQAAQLANTVASKWLNDALQVIHKRVMSTAGQGLFRCTVRFTDIIPCDVSNQVRLQKALLREGLTSTFKMIDVGDEKGVEVSISWEPNE